MSKLPLPLNIILPTSKIPHKISQVHISNLIPDKKAHILNKRRLRHWLITVEAETSGTDRTGISAFIPDYFKKIRTPSFLPNTDTDQYDGPDHSTYAGKTLELIHVFIVRS